MKHAAFIIFLCVSTWAFAQHEDNYSWEDFVEEMADFQYDAQGFGGEENGNSETTFDAELFEVLHELAYSPLNINAVSKDDLLLFPFINEKQADDILAYIDKNGPMTTLGELMLIGSLDKFTRDKLRLFVYAGEDTRNSRSPSLRDLAKYANGDVSWRSDIPFYYKAGNKEYPESVLASSPNKKYVGNRYHHSLRMSLSSMNHVFAGMQAEKDAGERGIDHIAGYLMVKDLGIVKRAVVGNYRVSFGQGLAINTSMKMGKMMMLNKTHQMDAGFAKHSSTAEYGYFTGAATTLSLGSVLVSAFASHRNADATFRNDSLGVTALKTDGLHRTPLERSKDGNIGITDMGGNIHWGNAFAQLSATAVHTHLDTPLMPQFNTPSTLYRKYNAQGKDFTVGSIAYSLRHKHLHFIGESAVSNAAGITYQANATTSGNQTAFATINTLHWTIDGSNSLTAIARWYGYKYVSLNGKAFGENANVQNEDGLFVGWSSRSFKHLNLDAYVDLMYFPWRKYKVSNFSYGMDAMAQAEYSFSPSLNLLVRYRMKSKQQDYTDSSLGESNTFLTYKTKHSTKMQINWSITPHFTLRTQANATITQLEGQTEKGYSITEGIRWKSASKLTFDAGITYFNTDSYDSRISIYEPSLLYSFGFTSHFYKGIRATLLTTIPLMKNRLFITAKIGGTHYFNRSSIGTGTELISANHREDLQIQIRYKI